MKISLSTQPNGSFYISSKCPPSKDRSNLKMQTVLLPCIAKKIPHWFLPHSSTQLRIRPIWSSSIKVIIDQPFFLSASSHFLSLTTISLLFKQMAAEDYTFGPYKIHHTEVFYSTNLSYAMVNLRPLLPGNNK